MLKFSDMEAKEIEQALILTRAEIEKLRQTLAEKDRDIKHLTGVLQLQDEKHQRELAKKDREIENYKSSYERGEEIIARYEREIDEVKHAYQQLMAQAVLFAKAAMSDMTTEETIKKAQAFLKEREGT